MANGGGMRQTVAGRASFYVLEKTIRPVFLAINRKFDKFAANWSNGLWERKDRAKVFSQNCH
jgi:hypothetical protein